MIQPLKIKLKNIPGRHTWALVLVCMVILVFSSACTTTGKQGKGPKLQGEFSMAQARNVLARVNSYNNKGPSTIQATFSMSGVYRSQKFRVTGVFVHDTALNSYRYNLFDYVFKSPVLKLENKAGVIKIYLPLERRLLVYSQKRPSVKRFVGMSISYRFLQQLFMGKVPVISSASIKNCHMCDDASRSLLILENSLFYQTIHMQRARPSRFLLTEKKSGLRFESYYKRFKRRAEIMFPSRLRLVQKSFGLDAVIDIHSLILNRKVTVKPLKVPQGTTRVEL